MKKLILLPILVFLASFAANANEYVANIEGTNKWAPFTKIQFPSNNFVTFKSKIYAETFVMVYAVADIHLPLEECTPFYKLISWSHAKLDKEEEIPYIIVGDSTYSNVKYKRYVAQVNTEEGNIKIWQFFKGNVEYTIMAFCPNAQNVAVDSFITHNLKLLPPPPISEEEFLTTVSNFQNKCSQKNGILLDEGLKIIKVEATTDKKRLIRTYEIDDSYPQDMREMFLSREGNEEMVENEKDTVLLVQQAISLGYTIVYIWQNQKGEHLATYEFSF